MEPARIDYKQALQFEIALRGSYGDLAYTPTFRASAIFFVLVNERINTHISFMNYWREKNQNDSVSAMLTLRDSEGVKVSRKFSPVKDFVYQFNLREMVASQNFTGSLEVELFSNHDLKYSFPAIEVFYESPDGMSFVHSNQRVFNDVTDMDRNSRQNPWQTGFDIFANDACSGYLSVINGPRSVPDAKAELKIFNSEGQEMSTVLTLEDLPPYSARYILLKDVPGIQEFLQNAVGFCKVNIDTFGVFMRIACGNITHDRSRMAVTHSFYDCSNQSEYYLESETPKMELSCFTPFNLIDNIDLDFIFYPIYAKARLDFSLNCFAPSGDIRSGLYNFASFDTSDNKMLRINIREVLKKNRIRDDTGGYCLIIRSPEGKIPARLTYGLNYYQKTLGCNINHSIWLNHGYGNRRRIYLWGAGVAREGAKNWILVSHFSKVTNAREDATITISIFGAKSRIIAKTYQTKNRTSLNLNIEELLAEAGYTPAHNEVLWYTAESDCPNYVSNQIHVSRTGFVGGCHSF